MEKQEKIQFKPRKSFNRIWIIMAGFGVFIPIGIVIFFLTGDKSAFAMAGFGFIPLIYLLYRVLTPGSVYSIGRKGVFLRNGSSKILIPLDEIRGAAVLSEENARKIITWYMAPGIEGERERDLKLWYKSNKAYNYFIQFCTVPIVQETASAGHEINIVKFGTKVSGEFVLLKLKSGQEYILSPEDCAGFVKVLSSHGRLEDTSPETSYVFGSDIEYRKKLRNFYKWYKIIAISIAVILMAVFTIINLQPKPSAPESGWLDNNTYRQIVTAVLETSEKDPEARKLELYKAVNDGYMYSFTNSLINWYCKENNLEPDADQYDALHNALWEFVSERDPKPVSVELNEDVTEIIVGMDLNAENLRELLLKLLDSVEY